MRRLASAGVVLAVAAVGVAALVDVVVGSDLAGRVEATGGGARPAGTAPTESSFAECRRDQLALAFEKLGGDDAVVLRHVRGGACHLARVTLQITVVDRGGRRSVLPLGEEAELAGDFTPGFEEVVPFHGCSGKAPLVATAIAGSYSATSRLAVGATRCVGATQRRVVRLGRGRDASGVYVLAFDPAANTFTVKATLPHAARVKIVLYTASGLRIKVLDAARRDDFCRRRGADDACVIPFPALERERPGGAWVLRVRKSSPAPARVRLSVSFEPVR